MGFFIRIIVYWPPKPCSNYEGSYIMYPSPLRSLSHTNSAGIKTFTTSSFIPYGLCMKRSLQLNAFLFCSQLGPMRKSRSQALNTKPETRARHSRPFHDVDFSQEGASDTAPPPVPPVLETLKPPNPKDSTVRVPGALCSGNWVLFLLGGTGAHP